MTLDKNTVDKLLMLGDDQLAMIIRGLAAQSGIDPSIINIGHAEINGIRNALRNATDEDLKRADELIRNYKNGMGGM